MNKPAVFFSGIKAIYEAQEESLKSMGESEFTEEQKKKVAYKLGIMHGLMLAQNLLLELANDDEA